MQTCFVSSNSLSVLQPAIGFGALAVMNGGDGGLFSEEQLPDPADIMVVFLCLINCNEAGSDPYNPITGTSNKSDDRCAL